MLYSVQCTVYTLHSTSAVQCTVYTLYSTIAVQCTVQYKNVIRKHVRRSLHPGGNGPMARGAAMPYLDWRDIAAIQYSLCLRSMTAMELTGCQRTQKYPLVPVSTPKAVGRPGRAGRAGFKTGC